MSNKSLFSIIQKLSRSVANFLRKVLILGIIIAWGPLCFIVGARLYETGRVVGLEGATVFVSGVCETTRGQNREGLIRDQMVVSGYDKDSNKVSGVLRKTRETIVCDLESKATIDRFAYLSDWNKPLIEITELERFVPPEPEEEVQDMSHKRYINKDISVTGLCTNRANEPLSPFRDEVMSVINVKKSKTDGTLYFYGITEDKAYVVCQEEEIKFDLVSKNSSGDTIEGDVLVEPELPSFVGETVYVSGLCIPDKRYYKKVGKKNAGFVFYDLTDKLVTINEEQIVPDQSSSQGYKVLKISGVIKDREKRTMKRDGEDREVSFFGHRVICDGTEGSNLTIVPPEEASNLKKEIEKFNE